MNEIHENVERALRAHLNPSPGIRLRASATAEATVAVEVMNDAIRPLVLAVLSLGGGEDLGSCPYYLQDGSEGAHGPNTCDFGCSDEPMCQTCAPDTGWPYAIALRLVRSNRDLADIPSA